MTQHNSVMSPAELLEILSHHARFCRTHLGDDCTYAKEWDAMAVAVAALVAELDRTRELLGEARISLSELQAVSGRNSETLKRKCEALVAERDALREALEDGAMSLETIARDAGKKGDNSWLQTMTDVRGYAVNRARVARAALAGAGHE